MALTKSAPALPGSRPPPFRLPGADGGFYDLDSFRDAKASMVVFLCNHCPYVVAWIDRIAEVAREFAPRGLRTVGINSNDPVSHPADSFPKMKEFAQARRLPFPYLFDATQEVARAFGATCTPDIFVYDGDLRLAYHGRVDDHHPDAVRATRRDLHDAVAAILAGKPVRLPQEPSMGCNIKWREKKA